jgi:voltage-gated potassium channel
VQARAGVSTPPLRRARGFRRVFVTLLRALASTAALVAVYYLLPLDRSSIDVVIGILAAGLLALVGLVAFQVRAIMKAAYPVLRAVGALATSVPLFLLLFAATLFRDGHHLRWHFQPADDAY